ncbi:MAG: glycosyltransferase [Elusimicrobiota bacterium]
MIKIIQVVESGPSDAQAAGISARLDPAKFEAALVDAATGEGELRKLFAERRPDVVHSYSSIAALRAAKSAGVKNIFYSPRGYASLSPDLSFVSRSINRLAERSAARIGTTIASSPSEAEQARALGAANVVQVRDAYLGEFLEPKPHEGLVVASSGPMTSATNPDSWVLLAQRLCDSRNGLGCLWIGGGEDEAAARVNLTNMNLLSKVEVTGAVPADAARERLRGIDLFVHYTRAGASSAPILDAMAYNLPVVASDLPAHRDMVENGVTGYLVKDEVELLERCQALLDDDDLRRRMGAAARGMVIREFSRERQLSELSRLYSA